MQTLTPALSRKRERGRIRRSPSDKRTGLTPSPPQGERVGVRGCFRREPDFEPAHHPNRCALINASNASAGTALLK